MTERDAAIVVIGATGYTGRLVARELASVEAPVVLAARDPDRLAAVTERHEGALAEVVDVTDPASVDRLIRRGDAVINTAGPFTELGEPVIRACIRAGAHYLDTTAEQSFIRDMYRKHHEAAVAAGVAVVNGMAFEYALGDCAVAVAAESVPGPIRAVDVVYAWAGTASSVGTRRTSLRMLDRKGWARRGGAFHRERPAVRQREVTLASGSTLHAVSFGFGEVVMAPRHLDVATVRCWIVVGRTAARVAPMVSPALPFLVPVLRPLLEALVTRKPDPTAAERAASPFTIRVELEPESGSGLALEVQGTDPYGLTAVAAVRGALRAMEPDAPAGVLTPAQLVEPRAFLEALAPGARVVGDPTT